MPVVPTSLGFDPRLQLLHFDDALAVLRRAAYRGPAGVFNVAGDGALPLSLVLRRAGRLRLPVPAPAISLVGALVRNSGALEVSAEQASFLNYGRVVDTTRLKERFGYHPVYSSDAALDSYLDALGRLTDHAAAGRRRRPAAGGWNRAPDSGGYLRGARRRRCLDRTRRSDTARRVVRRAGMTESGEGPTARVIPWRTRGTSPADAIDILAERGREAAVITLPADHRPPGPASSPPPDRQRRLSDAVAFGRRRITGQYGVDEFGFDADLTEHVLIPALRPLYDRWFRVEVNGTENIPVTGGALLVANHGGGLWPLDAVMTAVAVHEHSTDGRFLRTLAADLLLRTPGFGALARKAAPPSPARPTPSGCCAAASSSEHGPRARPAWASASATATSCSSSAATGSWPPPCAPACRSSRCPSSAPRRSTRSSATPACSPACSTCPTSRSRRPSRGSGRSACCRCRASGTSSSASRSNASRDASNAADPAVIAETADQVHDAIQVALQRLLGQRRSVWR